MVRFISLHLTFALLVCACSSSPSVGEDISAAGQRPPSAGRTSANEGGGSPLEAGASAGQAGIGGATAGADKDGNSSANVEILRSSVAADYSPDVSEADYNAFIEQLATFGVGLGQKLVEAEQLGTKNHVYSPLSAAYALAMTYAGARGDTAAEMKTVLGDSFSGSTYHSAANRLARELASRELDQSSGSDVRRIELNLTDSIFIERTREVHPAFLDLLALEYDSGVRRVDFRNAFDAARMTINDWVAAQTHDKILELLPVGSVNEDTPDVLVNALYFYGSWRVPFARDATRPADFHSLSGGTHQVDTMFERELQAGYASTADYSLAALSYVGDHLSMVILLPAQGKFESVRSTISGAWLKQQLAKLDTKLLSVALPKFEMTVGSFSLKTALEALGMRQAFSDKSDFSGIAPMLSVADVLQKCFIAVNEEGTKAAAATSSVMRPSRATVDQPIPFVVDRPFLFFVRDDSGAILFSGQVVDPLEE